MFMIRKFLLLTTAIALLSGCRAILLKVYGIKNPQVESAASIKKYALKQGLDTALIVSVNPADFKSVIKSGSGIPDAAVFDHNGAYIEYRATDTSCNAGLFGFIPSLHPGGDYNRTGKTTLQAELGKLRALDGRLFPKPEGNSDFYLLIYWTKWTGKLNKDHVKEWQNLAKANTKSRIRIIEVNLDVQEYWPKEDQDRILGIMVKK